MGRVLAWNVFDHKSETWFGPAYGNQAAVPEDVAGRLGDHVWEQEPEPEALVEGDRPLERRTKAELISLAETHDPPIDTSGTKAELVERLLAAGVEG